MSTLREMTEALNAAMRPETEQEKTLRVAKHQADTIDFMVASIFGRPSKEAKSDDAVA